MLRAPYIRSAPTRRPADLSRSAALSWSAALSRSAARLRALALAGAVALAGCGAPPELTQPQGAPVPSPSHTASPTGPAVSTPPVGQPTAPSTPSTPAFGEYSAVACAGRPSGSQVISFLRRTSRLLPSGGRVTVSSGPLCAGEWQYTVLQVPDREPLQVVTTGAPSDLTLVTAGTNVCNAAVRATAPYGIRLVACEGGAGSAAGL